VELLVRRSSSDPASTSYPQPGQTRDSILLAHSDGLPTVFPFCGVAVRHGRVAGRQAQRFGDVHGALIVTDARTALASSDTGKCEQSMLVGQIRHDALVGVRQRRATAVLSFEQPDKGRYVARVEFGSVQTAQAAVREIAARSGCPSTS
jgi:arylsulfatase A-like enzyme